MRYFVFRWFPAFFFVNDVAVFSLLSKMKEGLSNHQPACLCMSVCLCVPTNNFESTGGFSWNLVHRRYMFNLQNGGRLNFWGGRNFSTDWWIWMKFCMGWWHWILCTVSLRRENRHISSSQNFLYFKLCCHSTVHLLSTCFVLHSLIYRWFPVCYFAVFFPGVSVISFLCRSFVVRIFLWHWWWRGVVFQWSTSNIKHICTRSQNHCGR
jgi:hypothetical protein